MKFYAVILSAAKDLTLTPDPPAPHGPQDDTDDHQAPIRLASSKSLSVNPPAECVESVSVTLLYWIRMSRTAIHALRRFRDVVHEGHRGGEAGELVLPDDLVALALPAGEIPQSRLDLRVAQSVWGLRCHNLPPIGTVPVDNYYTFAPRRRPRDNSGFPAGSRGHLFAVVPAGVGRDPAASTISKDAGLRPELSRQRPRLADCRGDDNSPEGRERAMFGKL